MEKPNLSSIRIYKSKEYKHNRDLLTYVSINLNYKEIDIYNSLEDTLCKDYLFSKTSNGITRCINLQPYYPAEIYYSYLVEDIEILISLNDIDKIFFITDTGKKISFADNYRLLLLNGSDKSRWELPVNHFKAPEFKLYTGYYTLEIFKNFPKILADLDSNKNVHIEMDWETERNYGKDFSED